MENKERLRTGLTDREAGLAAYELFFRNMELGLGLRELVEKKLKEKQKIKIFDLGCGKAVALKELKEIFGEKVHTTGLDAVKTKNHGIDEFIQGDALAASFPENCDIIVSFRAMHEIGECRKMLEKIEHSLSSKGEAILSIRCQEFRENRIKNLGKIKQGDIEFLEETLAKKRFNSMRVEGKSMPVVLGGVLVSRTGEKKPGVLKYIAGVNLFLKK